MELKLYPHIPSTNNKNYVYQTIKANIMELRLEPGQAVNETEIGKFLNISRTPVREAFIRLAEDHLIITYPQRGSYVSKIDMNLVQEGSFMRRCLEKAVYGEVAAHCPRELLAELRKSLAIQKAIVQSSSTISGNFETEFMQLDNDFHHIIFSAAGKHNIWESITSLNTHYNRLRFLELTEQTNIHKVLFQHEMLVNSFEECNPTGAVAMVDEHLSNIVEIMPSIQQKYASYFL